MESPQKDIITVQTSVRVCFEISQQRDIYGSLTSKTNENNSQKHFFVIAVQVVKQSVEIMIKTDVH